MRSAGAEIPTKGGESAKDKEVRMYIEISKEIEPTRERGEG